MASALSDISRWLGGAQSGIRDSTSSKVPPAAPPRGVEVGGWVARTESQAFEELLSPWPGAEVLEVGGGHGYLAGYLAKRGYHLTIVGNVTAADAAACRRLTDIPCRFLSGSLRHLPFPDRAFPVVISTSLVAHRGHWEAFVGELTRVADQAVIFSFPKRRSLNTLVLWLLPLRHGRGFHIEPTSFMLEEQVVNETLRELGFHPTGRHANVLFPSSLHERVGLPPLSMALEAIPYVLGLIDAFGSPVFLRAERDV